MPKDIFHVHCPAIETRFRFQANRCEICSGKLLEQGFLEYYGFPLLLSRYIRLLHFIFHSPVNDAT